jgi:hypothetical protein
MTIRCVLMILIGLISTSASAVEYTVMGHGSLTCEIWTAVRHEQMASNPEQWVLGFLTGIGFESSTGRSPLHGIDGPAIWAWIDAYCRAHPLDHIDTAAASFAAAHPR